METSSKKCLICYEELQDFNFNENLSPEKNTFSENLGIIFLLRKLLGIPSSVCEIFLRKAGNPSDWIRTCSRCELRVKDAFLINSQINKLSEKVDDISKEICKEIKETQTFESISTSSHAELGFVNVTREAREYVAYCQTDVGGSLLFPDVTIKHEEDEDDLFSEGFPEEDHERAELFQNECIKSNISGSGSGYAKSPPNTLASIKDSEKSYECSICNRPFMTSDEFVGHRRKYHEDLRLKANATGECEFCGKKYRWASSLRCHRIKAHNARYNYDDNVMTSERSVRSKILLKQCQKLNAGDDKVDNDNEANLTRNSANILHRKKTTRKTKQYIGEEKNSPECSDSRNNELVSELQNNVDSVIELETSKKPKKYKKSLVVFHCEKCPETFKYKGRLHSHLAKCHEIKIKEFKCTICNHASRTKANFQVHMQSHTGDRPYLCEICSKTFTHKNYLRWHTMKEHSDESKPNPFSCDQCDKICSNIYALRNHKMTKHEKIYKCICHICGAGFQSDLDMKIHMYSHTKEKPNKCSYPDCTAAYSQLNSLKRHIRAQHTKEKPYKCSQCDKKFGGYKNWKRHEESVHSDLRPFKCEICDKTFALKAYLLSHMKSHNNKNCNLMDKTKEYLKDNLTDVGISTTENMIL